MDNTRKKLTPKEAVAAAAYAFVHPTVESLAEAQACEHAYVNMGQDPDQAARGTRSYSDREFQYFFQHAWNTLRDEAGYEEGVPDIDGERKAWVKEATKEAKMVAKAGLPLTLENTRKAFEGKPPFEKKQAKKGKKKAK